MQLAHQLGRDARAGGDAGAELGEAGGGHRAVGEQLELGEEHGGDAVDGGGGGGLDGAQGGGGVEGLAREDEGGGVGDGGHVAEDGAEAAVGGVSEEKEGRGRERVVLEERRWAADDVGRGEAHAVADAVAVVEDAAVGQAGRFGHRGGAGGELDVGDFVWMEVLVWEGPLGVDASCCDVLIRRQAGEVVWIDAAVGVVHDDDGLQ